MADVDTNLYFNMSRQNKDGEYGVWEQGWRDPDSHVIHFGDPADVTEAARGRAAREDVDLNQVKGTGKDGKVTAADVDKAAKS